MQYRRLAVFSFFALAALVFGSSQVATGQQPQEPDPVAPHVVGSRPVTPKPPSGALTPAPANSSFNADPVPGGPARLDSRGQPTGAPASWDIRGGNVVKDVDDKGRSFARLDDGDATLISAPFTIAAGAKRFSFDYKFFASAGKENSLRVFVLSGPGYLAETEVAVKACACEQDWKKEYVDATRWAGQKVQLKFVRGTDSGTVAIDNVAGNLLRTKIGSNSGSAKAADPVDTSTGNFKMTYVDLAIPGKGVSLGFSRTYNAESTIDYWDFDVALGNKWSHTYSMGLVVQDPNLVIVRYTDGKEDEFDSTDGINFTGPAGNYDKLVKSGSTFTLTRKNQVKFNFATTIYNNIGSLSSIVDRNNNTTTINRMGGPGGAIQTVTDAGGRSLTFTYLSGRISQITDPLGRTVQFGYNGNDDLTQVTDVAGKVTTFTYSSQLLLYTTDPLNNKTFTNTYDANDRVVEQKDALNGITCFYYGGTAYSSGNCSWQSPPAGETWVRDPRGYLTKYSFDSDHKTTQIVDATGEIETYDRDANFNVTCFTDRRGWKSAFTYDSDGNLTVASNAKRTNQTTCAPGGSGVSTFTYTSKNDVNVATDPMGRKVDYDYNGTGNLDEVRWKDSSNVVKKFACFTPNSAGLVTESIASTNLTSCTGNTAKFAYDTYGNVTEAIDPKFAVPGTPKTTMTYDIAGRLLTSTNELGQVVTYTYNLRNQVVTATNNMSQTTTNTYDDVGNLKTVTDALGRVTIYNYDALYRLTSVVNSGGKTTTYEYDANGNLKKVTDPNSHVTEATYNSLNRRTQTKDALNRTHSFVYDEVGNLTRRTDARGKVTEYGYDELNRNTLISYLSPNSSVAYDYDDNNNRTAMTDSIGTTTYAYDALNRLTQVFNWATWKNVAYAYNEVGQLSTLTYPSSMQMAYTYDSGGRMLTASTSGYTMSYAYDNAGKLVTSTYPASSGLTTTRGYDNAGRLVTLENKKGAATISSFTYTLDAVGQRTQVLDTTGTTTYAYDSIYRLTGVTYPGSVTDTYTYDDVGNRLTKTPSGAATINYTYDAADQMLTAGAVSYGYDNNGNQTSRGSDTFTWDHENRMTGATVGGTATTYGYNGDGLRAKKTQGWTTTHYTYSVRRSLPVLLDDGSNQYVYGLGLIGMVGPWWSVSYFLPDGLGSTANVTDASGNVTATYTYDVFGAVRTSSGSSTNPFGFTGEQKDAETGYTYLRARYYDPATGRFISRDPLGSGYKYASNNPVNRTDPSGLVDVDPLDPKYGGNYADYWMDYQAHRAVEAATFGSLAEDPSAAKQTLAAIGRYFDARDNGWGGPDSGQSLEEWEQENPAPVDPYPASRQTEHFCCIDEDNPSIPLRNQSVHRHHVMPQQFRDWFASKGINIDGKQWISKIPSQYHIEIHGGGYNKIWKDYIDLNPGATKEAVEQFAREMKGSFSLP